MKDELKQFNIDIEDIKEDNNLFDNIQKAIEEMNKYTLANRFEVILNNNLITFKEKCNDYRTIFGCRISYDDLDKNISFIVREDMEPSFEDKIDELTTNITLWKERTNYWQERFLKQKEVLNKIKEYIYRTEINSVGTPLAYTEIGKELLELLEEIE